MALGTIFSMLENKKEIKELSIKKWKLHVGLLCEDDMITSTRLSVNLEIISLHLFFMWSHSSEKWLLGCYALKFETFSRRRAIVKRFF